MLNKIHLKAVALALVGALLAPSSFAADKAPIRVGFLTIKSGALAAGGKQMEEAINVLMLCYDVNQFFGKIPWVRRNKRYFLQSRNQSDTLQEIWEERRNPMTIQMFDHDGLHFFSVRQFILLPFFNFLLQKKHESFTPDTFHSIRVEIKKVNALVSPTNINKSKLSFDNSKMLQPEIIIRVCGEDEVDFRGKIHKV